MRKIGLTRARHRNIQGTEAHGTGLGANVRGAKVCPLTGASGYVAREAPDFLVMATKLGAIRSLHKPFRPSVLLATVAACLDAANRPSSQAAAGRIVSGH
jgi:hypothetical protein